MARHRNASSDDRKVYLAIGTLAHNSQFTVRDLNEYVGFSTSAFVKKLARTGLLEVVGVAPVRYFTTPAGWKLIEKSL